VLLADDPFDLSKFTHEIVLGGWDNTKSAIFGANNETLVENATSGVVNCHDFTQFWIGWQSGLFQIFRGQPTGELLLRYQELNMQLVHAALISTGDQSDGEWLFSSSAGKIPPNLNLQFSIGQLLVCDRFSLEKIL